MKRINKCLWLGLLLLNALFLSAQSGSFAISTNGTVSVAGTSNISSTGPWTINDNVLNINIINGSTPFTLDCVLEFYVLELLDNPKSELKVDP